MSVVDVKVNVLLRRLEERKPEIDRGTRHGLIGFYAGWVAGYDMALDDADRETQWRMLEGLGIERVPLPEKRS